MQAAFSANPVGWVLYGVETDKEREKQSEADAARAEKATKFQQR